MNETSSAADTLVLPQGLSSLHGNFYADPFFFANPPSTVQAYSSGQFAGPIAITQIGFRIDESGGSLDVVVPRITLALSIFPGPIEEYHAEHLPGEVVVYDQQNVHLIAPNPKLDNGFNVKFPLIKPFIYDPRSGQLVLRFASRKDSGNVQAVDAQMSTPGSYFYIDIGGKLISTTTEIVTQFTYTAVPEPRHLIMFALFIGIPLFSFSQRK